MREFHVLDKGESVIKKVDGVEKMVTPWCGFVGRGVCEVVAGLEYSDGGKTYWGLAAPHNILQVWRTMKLLGIVNIVRNATIAHCYYYVEGNKEDLMKEQSSQSPLEWDAMSISLPSDELLNAMLTECIRFGVNVNEAEIIKEYERNGIAVPQLILDMKNSDETERKRHDSDEDSLRLETGKGNYFEVKVGDKVTVGRAGGGKYDYDYLLPLGEELTVTKQRSEGWFDSDPSWFVSTSKGEETWIWEGCIKEAMFYQSMYGFEETPLLFRKLTMLNKVRELKSLGYKVKTKGDWIRVGMSYDLLRQYDDKRFGATPNLESYRDLADKMGLKV